MFERAKAYVKERLKVIGDAGLALEKIPIGHHAPKPAPHNFCPHCGRSGLPDDELHETDEGPICSRCAELAGRSVPSPGKGT